MSAYLIFPAGMGAVLGAALLAFGISQGALDGPYPSAMSVVQIEETTDTMTR